MNINLLIRKYLAVTKTENEICVHTDYDDICVEYTKDSTAEDIDAKIQHYLKIYNEAYGLMIDHLNRNRPRYKASAGYRTIEPSE